MRPFTLCYFSAHSMEIPSLSAGVRQYQEGGGKIRIVARTRSQLFDESRIEAFVRDALNCDAVLVVLHGGRESCPAFDALAKAVTEKKDHGEKTPCFHIHPQGSDEDGLLALTRKCRAIPRKGFPRKGSITQISPVFQT